MRLHRWYGPQGAIINISMPWKVDQAFSYCNPSIVVQVLMVFEFGWTIRMIVYACSSNQSEETKLLGNLVWSRGGILEHTWMHRPSFCWNRFIYPVSGLVPYFFVWLVLYCFQCIPICTVHLRNNNNNSYYFQRLLINWWIGRVRKLDQGTICN